jgi:hypothetical protein
VKGGEVYLLGIDKLVLGSGAHVIDIVNEEWIGRCVTSQENDLCASRSERVNYCSSDT